MIAIESEVTIVFEYLKHKLDDGTLQMDCPKGNISHAIILFQTNITLV